MRISLLIILLFVSVSYMYGQQVFLETGTALSAFDYRNSDGERLDNLYGGNHLFLKAGFHSVTPADRLSWSAGLSYAGYVSKGSDNSVGNYFEWDANYLGLDLGLEYEIIRIRFTKASLSDMTVYVKTAISPEILVHGTQVINEQVYNLSGAEQFKYPFLFARGGFGICYSMSRLIAVYAEAMAGYGFPVKFGDKADMEKLRIISGNIGFGIFVNLPSYKSWK